MFDDNKFKPLLHVGNKQSILKTRDCIVLHRKGLYLVITQKSKFVLKIQ